MMKLVKRNCKLLQIFIKSSRKDKIQYQTSNKKTADNRNINKATNFQILNRVNCSIKSIETIRYKTHNKNNKANLLNILNSTIKLRSKYKTS
jgi:hypothetical protein